MIELPARFRRTAWGGAHRLARWAFIALSIVALVVLALGLGMVALGAWLIWYGDTPYYLVAGLLLCAAAVLILLRGFVGGLWLMAAAALLTLLWALWEIAGKGWMPSWGFDLAARTAVIFGLLILSLAIFLLGSARRHAADRTRPLTIGGIAVLVLGGAGLVAMMWERPVSPGMAHIAGEPGAPAEAAVGAPQSVAAPLGRGSVPNDAAEWAAYGGSHLGHRFTPADQITPANVSGLREVWRLRTGDLPPSDRVYFSAQNTPLKIDDAVYACSSSNIVLSLDPATGEERWRFDPEVPPEAMEQHFSVACRSVGYHEDPGSDPASACGRRIYVATADSRLYALDAASGTVCAGFGEAGRVDLAIGLGMTPDAIGFASSTSGPAVIGDRVIVGQQVSNNQRADAPSGVVRAYHALTGELLWAWDAERPDPRAPLPPGEIYPQGTPNVWNVISGDEAAGLVYLGTANGANDHWGGTRSPRHDETNTAVIAVSLESGETQWIFRTVEHDIWDYDIGAQPVVADLPIEGEMRRVIVQGTKTGSIFVLDAATGEPLRPVAQEPAPQGPLPGDFVPATQPRSTFYPNFAGLPGSIPEVLDARHAFGATPIDKALCRIEFHRMRYEGMFTPPTDQGLGTLLFPGTIGGINWGGIGLDVARNIVVTNHSRLPNRVQMIPREEVDDLPVGDGGSRPDQEVAPHAGSPWGVDRPIWLGPLDMPCIAPPWGFVAATDLDTGALLWSRPLGTGYDSGPLGIPTFLGIPMGTANVGGPLVTATGLTFIAAAQDDYLRAYETETGRLMWRARLPAGGQASPLSYVHEGRQYVVIAATGHERLETTVGDYILAFALEEG